MSKYVQLYIMNWWNINEYLLNLTFLNITKQSKRSVPHQICAKVVYNIIDVGFFDWIKKDWNRF